MLLLLAGLILGVWLLGRSPRLEGAGEAPAAGSAVQAWVDGKRVDSYLKED